MESVVLVRTGSPCIVSLSPSILSLPPLHFFRALILRSTYRLGVRSHSSVSLFRSFLQTSPCRPLSPPTSTFNEYALASQPPAPGSWPNDYSHEGSFLDLVARSCIRQLSHFDKTNMSGKRQLASRRALQRSRLRAYEMREKDKFDCKVFATVCSLYPCAVPERRDSCCG